MGEDLYQIWVYLAAEPLTGLFTTLAAYRIGLALFERLGRTPLLNPVLTAVLLIVGLLTVTDVEYATYFEGAQFVHFLLGPATVALAIPLYNQLSSVRQSLPALAAAILVGSLTAAGTAVGVAWVLDASPQTIFSLAPKSVTTPIAMGVAERLGGLPSLTAVLVILSGILGAIAGPGLLRLVGVHDDRAGGVAIGTASHGIGTARALQTGEVAGAFSGLAMGLNGLATAVLLPVALGASRAGRRAMSARRARIDAALLRLAPRIPGHERGAVVDHALDSKGLKTAHPEAAAWLSLVAYVRHVCTDYDALLAEGYDAESARFFVAGDIDDVLEDWGCVRSVSDDET